MGEYKHKIIWMMLIFLLIVVAPLVSSITLQELIDSYSFDYYGGEIDVSGVSDSMYDRDVDGMNDTFSFDITVDNAISGSYIFYIDLIENNTKVINSTTKSLTSFPGVVSVNISTELLSASEFNYTLRIYDINDSLVYREDLTTQQYGSYEEGFSIVNINDENVGNNLIRLNVTINSSKTTTENVSAFLSYNDSFISSVKEASLSNGLSYVIIDFDNETIKSTHYDGTYIIDRIVIGSKSINLNQTISNYNYEDFAKTSYLKSYTDNFIDLDVDNLTDFLQLNFTLNIKTAGVYTVEADIYDLYDEYLITLSENQSLSTGDQIISIDINGSDIYSSGINGPYEISISRLIFNNKTIDSRLNAYFTNISSYYDFERPPLPDLNISIDIYYNGSDNLVNVSVWNIGTATAFNVFVDVFDANDTYEGQDSLAVLNVSGSRLFNFVANATANNSIFVAVVDFDNLVDESNESNNVISNAVAPNITQVIVFNESSNIDGDVGRGEKVSFNVTITDDNSDIESVWLKIWSGVAEISSVIWQGFLSLVTGDLWSVEVQTNESFPFGEINYTLYANDSTGNEISQNGSFNVVDITPPDITSLTEIPSDPVTYSQGEIYEFNANVTDGTGVEDVLLEFNGANYTASANGDIYNVSLVDLGVGIYNYRWFANDSYGNINNSENGNYTVNKATPVSGMTLIGTSPITYGTAGDFEGSESNNGDSDCVYELFRDGVLVNNPNTEVLGAGTYSYDYNTTGCGNYTNGGLSDGLVVDKATPILTFLANGDVNNLSLTYSQEVNVSAVAFAGTVGLDRDSIDVLSQNGLNVTLGSGSYIYRANITGNENYTDVGYSYYNVTINQAGSEVYTYLNHIRNNLTTGNDLAIWINGSLQTGEGNIKLYQNGTLINQDSSPLSNYTLFNVGFHNITAIYESTQNYSSSYETWWLNVSDTTPPTFLEILDFNESGIIDGNIIQGDNVSFNITVIDEDSEVESVWLKIWQGAIGISAVIWQGFLSLVSGDLWTASVETNESFGFGEVNYTVYANDTLGNEVSGNGSFNI